MSRFRPNTAIVSGTSAAVSSGAALLASCSSSEITTDGSFSCSVVFGRTAVYLFDFDFDTKVSEITEVNNFDFDAGTAEVADAEAEILCVCVWLLFLQFILHQKLLSI